MDGDQILALIAQSWRRAGRLRGGGVVATVMSNLGLERFLAGQGLGAAPHQVGDRYVVERMRADGFNLGGEQSGHMIMADYSTTGDGLVAALQVLAVLVEDGPAGERGLPRCSTRCRSACAACGSPAARRWPTPRVEQAVAEAERELAATGRLLLRASGTEPVVRVMAEGEDEALVNQHRATAVRHDRDAARRAGGQVPRAGGC